MSTINITQTAKPSGFARLRDNSWGVRVFDERDLTGQFVQVTRRSDGATLNVELTERVAQYRDARHPALYRKREVGADELRAATPPLADGELAEYLWGEREEPAAPTDLLAMAASIEGRPTVAPVLAESRVERHPIDARAAEARRFIANAIAAYEFEADIPKEVGEHALSVYDELVAGYER